MRSQTHAIESQAEGSVVDLDESHDAPRSFKPSGVRGFLFSDAGPSYLPFFATFRFFAFGLPRFFGAGGV